MVNSCNILTISDITLHQNKQSACLNASKRLFCASTSKEETSVSLLFLNNDEIMIIIIFIGWHLFLNSADIVSSMQGKTVLFFFWKHSSTHLYSLHLMYWALYKIVWFTNGKLIKKKIVQLDYVVCWSGFFKSHIKYRMTFSFKSLTEQN